MAHVGMTCVQTRIGPIKVVAMKQTITAFSSVFERHLMTSYFRFDALMRGVQFGTHATASATHPERSFGTSAARAAFGREPTQRMTVQSSICSDIANASS